MKKRKTIVHINHKCKYCKEWYRDSQKSLNRIKEKDMRKRLNHLFRTLWINNSGDFDIIFYEFAGNLGKKEG
ncbi:hypothetical protein J4454_03430 [Candidatus Pacearchaeota archaeon]|nr:hypothetical protein [Candidatus Pacearchaeota archaeon]HIH17342.1 hypothetical protein [Nanoarchaeota archaeon]